MNNNANLLLLLQMLIGYVSYTPNWYAQYNYSTISVVRCTMKKDIQYDDFLNNKHNVYVVHYSCQNLNDDIEGFSPRITSIAVLHLRSKQMSSFSMHIIAEELEIKKDEIGKHFDEIEKNMLERFFTFAEKKGKSTYWLHWNMNNMTFGFQVLEHRYKVLTKKEPYHIDENSRYSISSMLKAKYGSQYARDPKMMNLMELNDGKHRDFLTGNEEVTAFKANEFVKMHKSTMCKVYFFADVLERMNANELKTETNQFRYKVNELYKNPIVQIVGILGVLGTFISIIIALIK